jgi:hypothetical protein
MADFAVGRCHAFALSHTSHSRRVRCATSRVEERHYAFCVSAQNCVDWRGGLVHKCAIQAFSQRGLFRPDQKRILKSKTGQNTIIDCFGPVHESQRVNNASSAPLIPCTMNYPRLFGCRHCLSSAFTPDAYISFSLLFFLPQL